MYLSKVEMSLSDRSVRAALQDAQRMHQMAAGLYQTAREDAHLLYRTHVRGFDVGLYLYADRPVDRDRLLPGMRLAGERDVTDWLDSMAAGQTWHFDLLTSPCKKVADGSGKNSRRRVLRTHEERLSWLLRKAEQNGFALVDVQENAAERVFAAHPAEKGGGMFLDAYQYSGVLAITDAAAFRAAVSRGIGPGKAYGLGMLLLKR